MSVYWAAVMCLTSSRELRLGYWVIETPPEKKPRLEGEEAYKNKCLFFIVTVVGRGIGQTGTLAMALVRWGMKQFHRKHFRWMFRWKIMHPNYFEVVIVFLLRFYNTLLMSFGINTKKIAWNVKKIWQTKYLP